MPHFLKNTLAFFAFICVCQNSNANDIRVENTAALLSNDIEYVVTIGSCSTVSSLRVGSASNLTSVAVQDLSSSASSDSCSFGFNLNGAERFEPLVEISRADGSSEQVSESFALDQNSPNFEFSGVEIVAGANGSQNLQVNVIASDDTDIAFLSFNVVGISASDLRSSGGVISEAKSRAFAITNSATRVYPNETNQEQFTFSLPLNRNLTAEEIAFDAVILVDAEALDASGNRSSFSQVAFTGDSIQEQANELVVSSTGIVINNALQTPVIIPSVDFQFRGLVALPGLGNGVSYRSTRPDLVGVTPSGLSLIHI